MNIREFTEVDRELYFRMARAFYSCGATLHAFNQEIAANNFDAIISGSPFIQGYILEEDGASLGYALLAHSWSTEMGSQLTWLEEIYLSDACRGKGIGSKFLEWLTTSYSGAFRLEVSPENTRVMELYRRFGFENLDYLQMMK